MRHISLSMAVEGHHVDVEEMDMAVPEEVTMLKKKKKKNQEEEEARKEMDMASEMCYFSAVCDGCCWCSSNF